jgi:trans-2,3-dihydro-3-hydroxyanthranilate isomerase
MRKGQFLILDVFAEKKFAGNQLAVFLDAANFSEQEMQILAKEMNYSETTFILTDMIEADGYPVRIFTPEEEVPFAGHPTLGTAYAIQQEIIKSPVDRMLLKLKIGDIPVSFTYLEDRVDSLWMVQKEPTFGEKFEVDALAEMLSLRLDDIDVRFPIQEVSTGLPFIIVPLKNLAAVKKALVKRDLFFDFIESREVKSVLVFCPETYSSKNQINVRVFVDYFGIPEDRATGSANGCLAGYLVKYHYFNENKIDVRVEQGFEIGRPSHLYLRASEDSGKFYIEVGGKVVSVAKGELT